MTQLDTKKFIWGLYASIALLAGMHIRNGYEFNFGKYIPFVNAGTKIGPILRALGFIMLALAVTTKPGTSGLFNLKMNGYGALAIFAIGLIYAMGTQMKKYQTCDATPDSQCPNHLVAGFTGGWIMLVFALIVQGKFRWNTSFLAVLAGVMVVSAKLFTLPTQRVKQQVDGPGYTMVTGGLFALTLANSL